MSKKQAAAKKQEFEDDPLPAGGNRAAAQAKLFEEIDKLAEDEGEGGNARPRLAMLCVQWAHAKEADIADATPIYQRYIDKVENVTSVFGGTRKKGDADSGFKQNVSKIRQFLKMGGLDTIDPVKVMEEATEVIRAERTKGVLTVSPFDGMLNIARHQVKYASEAISRDEMIRINLPRDKGDTSEADGLGHIGRRIDAHMTKWGESEELTQAYDLINNKVDELGGTSGDKKHKEKVEKLIKKQEDKRKVKRK